MEAELFNMYEVQETQMVDVKVTIAGRLDLGKEGESQIKSPLETDEQINDYANEVKQNVVKAETSKCAVCMDGRCAKCTAADLENNELPQSNVEVKILPKMAGGLYDMMTTSALLANWSGFGPEVDTYDKAYDIVAKFLDGEGYEDGGHSTDLSFQSDETTECAAWMKKKAAMEKGVKAYEQSSINGIANPLDGAVNGLNGFENPDDIMGDSDYKAIRTRQAELVAENLFATFDPIRHLRELINKNAKGVELLESDAASPTHGHEELALVVTEEDESTVNRDAMDRRPLVDDRWLRRRVAKLMSATPEEARRILMAGDVVTADVGDEILAPGFPVIIITAA